MEIISERQDTLCSQFYSKVLGFFWLLCPIWLFCNPVDCSLPGSSVHGILQARILEWVAIPFSRGPSQRRDPTHISCIAGGFFTAKPPWKPLRGFSWYKIGAWKVLLDWRNDWMMDKQTLALGKSGTVAWLYMNRAPLIHFNRHCLISQCWSHAVWMDTAPAPKA